jgi:Swiss Army Knife RNA repair-like protein
MGVNTLGDEIATPTLTPVIGTAGPPLDPSDARRVPKGRTRRDGRPGILMRDLGEGLKKPLLFVDIDGVLSVFGFPPAERPDGTWIDVDGVWHLISATASAHLPALARLFDLVWCSGWEDKADEHLVRILHLPARPPFLTFPVQTGTAHWKLASVERYAGDRPMAWIDDGFDDSCHAWAAARRAPTLLVATDPAIGLDDARAACLERFAHEVSGP